MVEVFKTNVQFKRQVLQLEQVLSHSEIVGWSFDLDDCDKVLRVMSRADVADFVIRVLTNNGFECCRLDW